VVMNVGIPPAHGKEYLAGVDELPEDQQIYFRRMVDESVLESEYDPELKEGFAYLDKLALKRKITFYDLILELYELSELQERIDEWKKAKGL